MTPEHRQAKKRLQAAIALWKNLEPPGWDIDHVFIEGPLANDDDAMAETKAEWRYHQATIRWSLKAAASQEEKYIEGTVVHELVHCLISGMEEHLRTEEEGKDWQNATCEWTVDAIARAILRVGN